MKVGRYRYLIPNKIRDPLDFPPLIFSHPQISCPFNFRAPLFYCKFDVFSFIRGIFSFPFNFCAFVLRKLTSFHFRAGYYHFLPRNYCAHLNFGTSHFSVAHNELLSSRHFLVYTLPPEFSPSAVSDDQIKSFTNIGHAMIKRENTTFIP